MYTGYASYNGSYITRASTINGAAFDPYMADATINPLTGRIDLSTSFTVVGSFLHYWTPQWRSAVFGSYGEMSFARGAREANAAVYGGTALAGNASSNSFVGPVGTRAFNLSPTLRDNYQIVAGASLIWSPVKDLDIGLEGFYTKVGVQNGGSSTSTATERSPPPRSTPAPLSAPLPPPTPSRSAAASSATSKSSARRAPGTIRLPGLVDEHVFETCEKARLRSRAVLRCDQTHRWGAARFAEAPHLSGQGAPDRAPPVSATARTAIGAAVRNRLFGPRRVAPAAELEVTVSAPVAPYEITTSGVLPVLFGWF